MSSFRVDHVPGGPEESGYAHGVALRDLLSAEFIEAYVARLRDAIGFDLPDLATQSARWLAGLPEQYQREIDGMGAGSGIGTDGAARFLYADIARSTPGAPSTGARIAPGDGGCSALVTHLDDGLWIARNCDWLTPTLMRGTSAVVHATPNRIPVLAVGIRGDIDVDTGLNAEGLWLHLHTLHASDDPPADRTIISWLFWAREALETCSTIDEVDTFVASTGRDRGVFAIVGEGQTGRGAVFECSRAGHVRHDIDPHARALCVTNHALAKSYGRRVAGVNPSGTISRQQSLRASVSRHAPETGPRDLIGHLGADGVEMRTPRWLRTIYSAVVRPADGSLWFASGRPDGTPAASTGAWDRVPISFSERTTQPPHRHRACDGSE